MERECPSDSGPGPGCTEGRGVRYSRAVLSLDCYGSVVVVVSWVVRRCLECQWRFLGKSKERMIMDEVICVC